jgi:hypothetical protein
MRQLEIAASAVEPEFVRAENLGGGSIEVKLEIARISITQPDGKGRQETTGAVSIVLLAADVDTLINRVGELVMEEQLRQAKSNGCSWS